MYIHPAQGPDILQVGVDLTTLCWWKNGGKFLFINKLHWRQRSLLLCHQGCNKEDKLADI